MRWRWAGCHRLQAVMAAAGAAAGGRAKGCTAELSLPPWLPVAQAGLLQVLVLVPVLVPVLVLVPVPVLVLVPNKAGVAVCKLQRSILWAGTQGAHVARGMTAHCSCRRM